MVVQTQCARSMKPTVLKKIVKAKVGLKKKKRRLSLQTTGKVCITQAQINKLLKIGRAHV